MLYKLKDLVRRARFSGECSGILSTAPVGLNAASRMVLLSQLQHKDVLLFMLAVKSFARQVKPRAVYVLDDGSLTSNDRAALGEHVPGLTFLDRAEFRSSACPRGGTSARSTKCARASSSRPRSRSGRGTVRRSKPCANDATPRESCSRRATITCRSLPRRTSTGFANSNTCITF